MHSHLSHRCKAGNVTLPCISLHVEQQAAVTVVTSDVDTFACDMGDRDMIIDMTRLTDLSVVEYRGFY